MPKHTLSERQKNRARAATTNRSTVGSSGGAMMKVSSQDPNVNRPGALPLMPTMPNKRQPERKL